MYNSPVTSGVDIKGNSLLAHRASGFWWSLALKCAHTLLCQGQWCPWCPCPGQWRPYRPQFFFSLFLILIKYKRTPMQKSHCAFCGLNIFSRPCISELYCPVLFPMQNIHDCHHGPQHCKQWPNIVSSGPGCIDPHNNEKYNLIQYIINIQMFNWWGPQPRLTVVCLPAQNLLSSLLH